MDAICLEAVSKTYPARRGQAGREAVCPLTLSISEGSFTGLLGPNGCGKSTLLRMLVGAETLTSGSIVPSSDREFRSRLGVVFQHPALDPILTVRENLRLAGLLFSLGPGVISERIASLASVLGVEDRLDSRVATLSGGLARRADLARALLPEPRMLVIDEATSSLDQTAREEFIRLILEQRAERSVTVIMSTHRPEELESADRVLIMNSGRMVADGAPDGLTVELGRTELRIESPSRPVLDLLRGSGLGVHESGREIVMYKDRFDNKLLAALQEQDASVRIRPTDLASVYRHRLLGAEGEPA